MMPKPPANYRKHGVTLWQAASCYFVIHLPSSGLTPELLMAEETVIHSRHEAGSDFECRLHGARERFRIISARRATKYEKDDYYRQNAR